MRRYLAILLLFPTILTLAQDTSAPMFLTQFKETTDERKHIGAMVPLEKYIFKQIKNYPFPTLKLSDFAGKKKLIILDFWSKWCSACITAMPKMEELQRKYNNEIQIVLVTGNSKEELVDLFSKSKILQNIQLPMIFSDTMLSNKLFPHVGEPYHIWIDGNGKVLATVNGDQTDVGNIESYLRSGRINAVQRYEVTEKAPSEISNPYKSLTDIKTGKYISEIVYISKIPEKIGKDIIPIAYERKNIAKFFPRMARQYSLIIDHKNLPLYPEYKSFTNDIPLLSENGIQVGIKLYQYPLFSLLLYAYKDFYLEYPDVQFKDNWFNKAIEYYELTTDTTRISRLTQTRYSYELQLDEYSDVTGRNILRKDIERHFGIRLLIDTITTEFVHLYTENQVKLKQFTADANENSYHAAQEIITIDSIEFIQAPLARVINYFNAQNSGNSNIYLTNETGLSDYKLISITLRNTNRKLSDENIEKLNEDLVRYGLKMKKVRKLVKALILKNAFE